MGCLNVNNVAVFTNSSNRASVQLLECDNPIDLRSVTKVAIDLVSGPKIDSDTYPTCFQWGGTVEAGVIYLFLGKAELGLGTGVYNGKFFIYDDWNYQGAFIGDIRLFVYDRPED